MIANHAHERVSYSDVDECASGVDECDQHCHNNIASYTCSCNDTYTLNPDGFHCDGTP